MPVMDGQRHRVATVEDKGGKKSGVYRGFLDRRPGGWFINYHRADTANDVTKWSATGGEADPITRLHIRAGARQAQDDAARERAETHARQTLAAQRLYDRLPAADPSHPYLVRKGITPTPDLRETKNGALVVPFFNVSGEFKTLQYIPPEGDKFLFKDAPKQGNFLVVGGSLEPGQPVLYAEGYATARSLNMATGHPVVMTIDAGNMLEVAKVLHERFPDSPHVFLADFDHAKAENKGLLMATAAAELVSGKVLYPAFTDDEKARGFTDYNDLHLSRGLDALRGQFPSELIRDKEVSTMHDNRSLEPETPNASDFNIRIELNQPVEPAVPIAEARVPDPSIDDAKANPSVAAVQEPAVPVSEPPPIASFEAATPVKPVSNETEAVPAVADPVTAPVVQTVPATTLPAGAPSEAVPVEAKSEASVTAVQEPAAPVSELPPIASFEAATPAKPVSNEAESGPAVADPAAAPVVQTTPALTLPVEVASESEKETPPVLSTGAGQPATAKEDTAVPLAEPAEPVAPSKKPVEAAESPSAEAGLDAIWVGPPRPSGAEVEPQASNIDKDALLSRLSWEKQGDNAVLYKLDGEAAFVDHGSRLEMASGASKSDEMVVAALLTAAQYYRGRIELTGSDEFKEKAIGLIAQHQINVEMKNPAQQALLEDARKAFNKPQEERNAVTGDITPVQRGPEPTQGPVLQTDARPVQGASQELNNQTHPSPVKSGYQPLEATDLNQHPRQPVEQQKPEATVIKPQPAAPATATNQTEAAARPAVSPEIHQPFQAAKDGVTGKILASGQAPFRFNEENAESTYIKLRTKTGIQTFWGKELAGLLRETRVQPGKMVTLQWLGNEPVTIKVPRKDKEGVTVGFDDKETHRNQWALTVAGSPMVRTGQDEGVKLGAYDAGRFAVVQQALVAQLGVDAPMPPPPKDGLYWLMPNGEGSAKTGDELSAPRPAIDPNNSAGKPVMSSWSQDGQLDAYLVRGDGPYLQGVARQGDQYQHVLVSLPGRNDAPPMVFNAITPEGVVPIGTGNGINRSGGEPVSRENIAFKLEGDSAVRIGKLDAPAEIPPALHARLGFDERWKEDVFLPKSAPTAAPAAQPSDPRPA
jgi:putative DNA primase/helicase